MFKSTDYPQPVAHGAYTQLAPEPTVAAGEVTRLAYQLKEQCKYLHEHIQTLRGKLLPIMGNRPSLEPTVPAPADTVVGADLMEVSTALVNMMGEVLHLTDAVAL